MIQRRDIGHLPQALQQAERTCSAATMFGMAPMAEKSRLSLPTPRRPQGPGAIRERTIFTSTGTSNAAGVIGLTPIVPSRAAPFAEGNAHMGVTRCKSKFAPFEVEFAGLANGGFITKGEARGAI
jgi:hypothetical protein